MYSSDLTRDDSYPSENCNRLLTSDTENKCDTLQYYTDPNYGPYTTTPTANGQHLIITYSNGYTFYQPVLHPTTMAASTMLPLRPSASISIRDYIYYLPFPFPPGSPIPYSTGLPDRNPLGLDPQVTEPTSTLVLTSPRGTFVDLRILLPLDPKTTEPLLPNTGGPLSRLDWAFGGESTSFEYGLAGPGAPTHSMWKHWVDSKVAVGGDMEVDEGDMYALPDGRTLEHGSSFNSAIGRMHSYEEMWSEIPIESCYPSDKKMAVVLRTENVAAGIRGLVVRLGQYCQGILMKGNEVSVERWEFVDHVDGDESVVDGEWTRTIKLGDMFLPCASTFKHEELNVDMVVKFTDYNWVVEELVEL
jgi:hypothetical protein